MAMVKQWRSVMTPYYYSTTIYYYYDCYDCCCYYTMSHRLDRK